MFAVVQVGSKQYKVAEGDVIDVDKLESESGKTVELDQVLLVENGKDVRIGKPTLEGVTIKAKVLKQTQGEKVVAFKYRRRKDSASKKGSRAKLTSLSIEKINA